MATQNIIKPTQTVTNTRGQPLAGGLVYLYEPGTTTFITSYKESGLINAHSNPVKLSGSGRADIWITRDCDMQIYDRNGNLVLTQDSVNPDSLGVGEFGGLINNGSFEVDSDADLVPDFWTLTSETGSTNEIDTTEQTDGSQCFRFTSTGTGGGSLETSSFFPVNDVDDLRITLDIRSTVANVQNIVRVKWFDASEVSITNSEPYNSTSNPTTFTEQNLVVTPPSGARFAKLELVGCDPATAVAGSTYFDRVSVFYPAVVDGVFDNVTIQDNEIITTNSNGDLAIAPNGTGAVNVWSTGAVDMTDTKNPLNIGATDDPTNNPHLAFGDDLIQAKADATTRATLRIQPLTGGVEIGPQSGTGNVTFYSDGTIAAEADTDGLFKVYSVANTDTERRQVRLQHQDGTLRGWMGHEDSDVLEIYNQVHGGNVALIGEDGSGTEVSLFVGDPDGQSVMYHAGGAVINSQADGLAIASSTNDDPVIRMFQDDLATRNALIAANSSTGLLIENEVHGTPVTINSEDAGGTARALFIGDPDGSADLYYDGAATTRTLAAADGGLEVNNTNTGAGFERVLTTSDLGAAGATYAFKTAITSRQSTTTIADDPDLAIVAESTGHYMVEAFLICRSSTTADIKVALTHDASPFGVLVAASGNAEPDPVSFNEGLAVTIATSGTLTEDGVFISGTMDVTSVSPGDEIKVQWAQNTSEAQNTSLLAGSWLRIQRLGDT